MAVLYTDLLSPIGPVEKQLFPGEDVDGDTPGVTLLQERLEEYISQATTRVSGIAFPDADVAITAWSLHLTFKAAHILAVARPASEDSQVPVIGSQGYQKDQRERLLDISLEYLDEYNVLLAQVPSTVQAVGVTTHSVNTDFDY